MTLLYATQRDGSVSVSFLTFYFSPFGGIYSRSGGKTNENELKFNNKKRKE